MTVRYLFDLCKHCGKKIYRSTARDGIETWWHLGFNEPHCRLAQPAMYMINELELV